MKKFKVFFFISILFLSFSLSASSQDEPLMIGTDTEDLSLTDDLNIAKLQVEKYPDNAEAHFNLAIALSRTSKVEEAIKELRKTKNLIKSQKNIGLIDNKIKEYEEMIKNENTAHNIRYRLAFAHYLKGYFLSKEKEKEEKKKLNNNKDSTNKKTSTQEFNVFDSSKLSANGNDPEVKLNLDKSLFYFQESIKNNPTDIWSKIYYGFILAEQYKDYEGAKKIWSEAQLQDKNNPAPHFFLGELLIKEGYLKEGILEVSQALLLRSLGY